MTTLLSLLVVSLFLHLSFLHVDCASSGQLGYCNLDLTVRKYGNIATSAAPKNVVAVMPWVKAPIDSTFYTVRTGDKQDISKDPKTYIPDRWTPIHIRVHDLDRKYIGLVMYATNGNMSVGGQQVGEWRVTDNLPFFSPDACPTAITHKDADIKPLHTVFYFKAPAGTGRVKFHVMIKQGEQGKGNFFFPQDRLILDEGVIPTLPSNMRYIQATEKQSCAAACTAHATHKYCDVTATNNLNSPTALSAVTQGLYLCRPQMVSGCASSAPLTLDNFCTYKQTTAQCSAESRATNPTSCIAVPDAKLDNDDYVTARFCACSLNAPPTGVPTDGPVVTDAPTTTPTPTPTPNNNGTGTGLNAASSLSASSAAVSLPLLLTMCASLFLSSTSRHASLVLALVMFVFVYGIPSADAHNWVMSPSRALVASVTKPCQSRISPFPHIQVVPGQNFPMEWSVGHGDSRTKSYYWALVNAKDYQQLYFVDDALLEDYIRSAPPSGNNVRWYNRTTVGSEWEKRHVGNPNESDRDTFPIYESKYFAFVANQSTDPNYIVRDTIYREKSTFGPRNPALYNQWAFLANQTAKDLRVSYKSDKYPWLIAVHKFINVFEEHNPYAHQANIAQFEIPAGSVPGDYIYHFKWGGYRDCVDINVMAKNDTFTSVPLPFGKSNADALAAANGTAPFVKMDHCEFLFIHNPMTQCRIVSRQSTADASQCIADCAKNGGCTGVQLVRATNPAAVSIDYAPSVPYYAWNNTVPDMNGNPTRPVWACEWHSNNDRMKAGCRNTHPKVFNNDPKRPNPAYQCNYDVLRNMSKPASQRLQDDDYICFGLQPYRDQDLQAAEDFMTVNDPEDPKWYSTCWVRIEPGGFLDSPRPPPIIPDWAAGDSCVSCSFRNSATKLPITVAPKWTDALTNQCRNCDHPDL